MENNHSIEELNNEYKYILDIFKFNNKDLNFNETQDENYNNLISFFKSKNTFGEYYFNQRKPFTHVKDFWLDEVNFDDFKDYKFKFISQKVTPITLFCLEDGSFQILFHNENNSYCNLTKEQFDILRKHSDRSDLLKLIENDNTELLINILNNY
jgi:hypothetical protein